MQPGGCTVQPGVRPPGCTMQPGDHTVQPGDRTVQQGDLTLRVDSTQNITFKMQL